ncbi:MAG TPA: histidine kinase [Chitinophagaceae bacterium]|nr:histidine kinase [Chitinophagaceae bacterium]
MKISFDIKRFTFYLWVGFAYLLLWLFIDLVSNPGSFLPRVSNNIWRAAYIVIINFIFFGYTLPFVLKIKNIPGKILLSLLVFWMLMMLYSFGLYAWRFIGIQLHIYTALRTFTSVEEGVSYGAGYGVFSIFFFGIISHIYNYIKLKQAAQQLRIEKQAAELNYLKSQTNPHFLFNTLNNIYSLARDKSDLAPESILRLSKILRFMLYETVGAYIAIEQELKIISDYIALEKLRYDDSLKVNFNYDLEDMKQALPPLLLMPLVENAFKHGVSETRHQPFVDIHLSVNNRQLAFVVKNSAEAFPGERNAKESIGLSNLRRQLELLYTDYHLVVQQGESVFTAHLKINLASHV